MLVVECLYGTGNVVVRADSLLHVLTIVNVALLNVIILLFVACRGQEECKYSLGLLQLQVDWSLQIFNRQLLFVFFGCFKFLFVVVIAFGFGLV